MLRIDKNRKFTKGVFSSPDICEGPLAKNIILYTLPIMASGFLQLLFNAADSIVVGRFAQDGDTALAAVGATGALVNLIVNLLIGLSVGASVNVAHCWGAGDKKGVSEVVHVSILTAAVGGIAFGLFGFFMSRTFLSLMSTPPEIIGKASLYMKIYFLGLPAIMIYNFAASIMRSTGDTERPLIYLTVSGVINIILNLVFVICFGMDVDGVAIATVISQATSAVLCTVSLAKSDGPQKLELRKLRFNPRRLRKLLIIGIPAGLEGTVFSISNVLIQSAANYFGPVFLTGNSAASNLEGFIYIFCNSFYHAALTFVGQHVGAGKYSRLKKIVGYCILFVAITGVLLGSAVTVFSKPLLRIYIPDNETAVDCGASRLLIIGIAYFICGIMDTFTGSLRGMGASTVPMVISILGVCGTRIIWIYTVFRVFHTPDVLFMSYPISWAITVTIQFICYLKVKKRLISKNTIPTAIENAVD